MMSNRVDSVMPVMPFAMATVALGGDVDGGFEQALAGALQPPAEESASETPVPAQPAQPAPSDTAGRRQAKGQQADVAPAAHHQRSARVMALVPDASATEQYALHLSSAEGHVPPESPLLSRDDASEPVEVDLADVAGKEPIVISALSAGVPLVQQPVDDVAEETDPMAGSPEGDAEDAPDQPRQQDRDRASARVRTAEIDPRGLGAGDARRTGSPAQASEHPRASSAGSPPQQGGGPFTSAEPSSMTVPSSRPATSGNPSSAPIESGASPAQAPETPASAPVASPPSASGAAPVGAAIASAEPATSSAPSAPPAPAPPAPAAALEQRFIEANQQSIITALRGRADAGGGTMQIRLDPPELGAMQVRVEVREGALTAVFQASSESAARLLTQSLSQLKAALESQGVGVERLQVQHVRSSEMTRDTRDGDSSQRQSGGDAEQQQNQQEQQRRELLSRLWKRISGGDPLDVHG